MERVKHISPRAEQLVSEYLLGAVQAEYRDDWRKSLVALAIFLPLGLLFALVIPSLFFSSSTTGEGWSGWMELLGNVLPLLLIGSFLLLGSLAAIVVLAVTLWKGVRRVYVGEKGFISTHRHIDAATRWEGVREIRRRILFVKSKPNNVQQANVYSTYLIFPTEGKVCSLSNELGAMVESSVTAYLLPQAIEKYEAGQPLSFDWLALDQQGIHLTPAISSKEYTITSLEKLPGVSRTPKSLQGTSAESGELALPWSKLEMFWIDESSSTLVISQKDAHKHWAILPLNRISNVALCMAIVDHAQHDGICEVA